MRADVMSCQCGGTTLQNSMCVWFHVDKNVCACIYFFMSRHSKKTGRSNVKLLVVVASGLESKNGVELKETIIFYSMYHSIKWIFLKIEMYQSFRWFYIKFLKSRACRGEEWPPLAATRESPRTETKTQHSHK